MIAASQSPSATAAGLTESAEPPPSHELIDAINQVFALFRVNFHNQYRAAYGNSTDIEATAKKLWLRSLRQYTPSVILHAAEGVIQQSEYLPTLKKMLELCRRAALPAGLPDAAEAYREACLKPSPKAAQKWTHPIVFMAGKMCGWHELSAEPEYKMLPEYSKHYSALCDQLLAGVKFSVDDAPRLEQKAPELATEQQKQEMLAKIARQF